MSRKQEKIQITFVTVSLFHRGQSHRPSLIIQLTSTDIPDSSRITTVCLVAVNGLVQGKEHDLFFHMDIHHEYTFDVAILHSGVIYGRREMKKDDGKIGARVTTRNLIPIQINCGFKRLVAETDEVVYKEQTV